MIVQVSQGVLRQVPVRRPNKGHVAVQRHLGPNQRFSQFVKLRAEPQLRRIGYVANPSHRSGTRCNPTSSVTASKTLTITIVANDAPKITAVGAKYGRLTRRLRFPSARAPPRSLRLATRTSAGGVAGCHAASRSRQLQHHNHRRRVGAKSLRLIGISGYITQINHALPRSFTDLTPALSVMMHYKSKCSIKATPPTRSLR